MSNTKAAPKLLAKRIKDELDAQGMTLKTLSHDSGIAYSSLWRKLNRKPEKLLVEDLTAIADALNTDLTIGFSA